MMTPHDEIDRAVAAAAARVRRAAASMKSSVTCSSARDASGSPAKINASNNSSVISKAPRSGQLNR